MLVKMLKKWRKEVVFKQIDYKGKKPEIRGLLRKRQDIKRRIRYHNCKIEHHKIKMKELETKTIMEIEKQLNKYLGKE